MFDDAARVAAHEHQAWQNAADIYTDHIAFMTAGSDQFALVLEAAAVSLPAAVLDVGCGPGLLTRQLADHFGSAVGIDFAANMITSAKARFPDLAFHEADAENPPFADGTFDLVLVNYCAHHLARPASVFRALRQVLKPGGQLIIIHPVQVRQRAFGSVAQAVRRFLPPETVPGGPLLHVENPQEYLTLLQRCGYLAVAGHVRTKNVPLDDLETLLQAGWGIMGLADQSPAIQAQIRAATIENAAPYKQTDGTYMFPDEVLVIQARR